MSGGMRSWRPWPSIESLKSLVRPSLGDRARRHANWATDYGFLGFDRRAAALKMNVNANANGGPSAKRSAQATQEKEGFVMSSFARERPGASSVPSESGLSVPA